MTSAFGDQKIPMMTSISNVGKGWWPLVRKLEEHLNELSPDFELLQVKEKFGSLRYYASPQPGCTERAAQEFTEWIADAENESDHICEVCGEPGDTSPGKFGYLKTLCEVHKAERLVLDNTEETP